MAFEENLKKCGCAIKRDCRLKSSFGDEFTVKTAVFPSDFTAAAKAAKACGGAVYLGGITNTLVLGDIDIAVCMRGMKGIIDGERDLYVMAGESLASVCRWAQMRGLSGMEQLCGIPGTVGGAAAGNSGCYGREISDVLVYADVAAGGRIERLYAKDIDFSYRRSSLKGAGLILGVMLRLTPSDGNKIEEDMRVWQALRASTQPGRPSLGCTFKKCGDISSAYYIEQAGFKGTAVGGAQVSEKHAGFIVNTGTGTARDYYELAEKVRAGVPLPLEYEIEIINNMANTRTQPQ